MATRKCGLCGLPGHDRRAHRRNPKEKEKRRARRNLEFFTDKSGGVHPVRGSGGKGKGEGKSSRERYSGHKAGEKRETPYSRK